MSRTPLHCPRCLKRYSLVEEDYQVLHGNPSTPASDTEVEFTFRCSACREMYKTDAMGYSEQSLTALSPEPAVCPVCKTKNEITSYFVRDEKVRSYFWCSVCKDGVQGERPIPSSGVEVD